ncbi:hypothetical protein [Desulfoluna spongiiphila]|uniref:hypothetical protein n=1 Tax=Desulfoluna spongiiphila TaxID=419481 RepID=UPI0012529702|nr:hypothetical protein [Desulfoluna spongiiphila]VVS95371.1 hnh endonuclease 5 [Desulfoluna spongiiphila]
MKFCYLSGEIIDKSNKSLEHILPNALGGKLKSEYVLTMTSNQTLNKEIDVKFNKIFEVYHQRLNLSKDRKKNGSVKAIHMKYNEDIVVNKGRCYPTKPLYDPEKNTVYAKSQKMAEQYINHLKASGELKNENVTIFLDMAGSIEFKFGFDNKLFKKGLAKIAAGFATYKGVPREYLSEIINLKENKFKNDIIVAPYLSPTGPESYFEENVHLSSNYPIHSLVLYGNTSDRFLYCYVELFSTFQYFCVLDDEYDGNEIYETYFYDLSNKKEITYDEYSSSIPNSDGLKSQLPSEFRKYPKYYIQGMNNNVITDQNLLKSYTYFKANTLSAYVNYFNIHTKLQSLLAIKTN